MDPGVNSCEVLGERGRADRPKKACARGREEVQKCTGSTRASSSGVQQI